MIKSSFTQPQVDQATIDHYVGKAKMERSRAFVDFFRSLFSAPEVKATPVRKVATAA